MHTLKLLTTLLLLLCIDSRASFYAHFPVKSEDKIQCTKMKGSLSKSMSALKEMYEVDLRKSGIQFLANTELKRRDQNKGRSSSFFYLTKKKIPVTTTYYETKKDCINHARSVSPVLIRMSKGWYFSYPIDERVKKNTNCKKNLYEKKWVIANCSELMGSSLCKEGDTLQIINTFKSKAMCNIELSEMKQRAYRKAH